MGGPVGRIRYYFVPATNAYYSGLNVFWPSTEQLSDFSNVDGPGEIAGAPRSWHRGTNFRPDLIGDHPSGSAEDFAGLSPVPAVQPPPPSCAAGPGLSLPLEVRAATSRAFGHFGGPIGVLQVQALQMNRGLTLWLRRDDLAGLADRAAIDTWPDASQNGRDFVTSAGNIPARKDSDPNTGSPIAVFSAAVFPHPVSAAMTCIRPFQGRCLTLYVVGSVFGSTNGGGHVVGPGTSPLDAVLSYRRPNWVYSDNHDAVNRVIPTAAGVWHVWTVRKASDFVQILLDGVTLFAAPINPTSIAGVSGLSRRNGIFPQFASVWYVELMTFDYDLGDDQHDAVLRYLMGKYHINSPMTAQGGALGSGSSLMTPFTGPHLHSGGGALGDGASAMVWTGGPVLHSGGGALGDGSSRLAGSYIMHSGGGALGDGASAMTQP